MNSTVFQSATMVHQAAAKYEDMIVKDPNFTSNLESALKVASYIIPGAHYLETSTCSMSIPPPPSSSFEHDIYIYNFFVISQF